MQARSSLSPPQDELTSFSNQDPGFHHPRRALGRPHRFNGIPAGHRPQGPLRHPIRVVVYEDGVPENVWPTQFPRLDPRPPLPPPSLPQWVVQRHDNPQSSTNESKLTTDEQHNVLSKLRKEFYNPTRTPNLYFRDKNRSITEISKEKDENWKRCAVCLEDFEKAEEVTLTPCNHMFHEECIVPWVENQGLCPVCRFAICDRLNENSATPARAPGTSQPRHPLPPPPPPVDSEMLAIMRALMLDDDLELQNMIPVLIRR